MGYEDKAVSMFNDPQDFYDKLRQNPLPVVVDFWASWCAPCRSIAPILTHLKQEYNGRVDVWQVNADDYPLLLHKLGVRGIPTLIAFNHGYEITRVIGARPPQVLESIFRAALDGISRIPTLSATERMVRTIGGFILLFAADQSGYEGWMLLVGVIGGIVFFSGIYDYFQIFRTLKARLDQLLRKK